MKTIRAAIAVLFLFAGLARLEAQSYSPRYQHKTAPYSYEAPARTEPYRYSQRQTTDRNTAILVQKNLAKKGFYYGAADGVLGTQSRDAIKRYQVSAGLRQTGLVDDRLLKALHINTAIIVDNTYSPPAYTHQKSVAIEVQSALAKKGYYSGRIDGALGPQSREAIRQYQFSRGLRGTGLVDESLLRSLGLL